MKHSRYVLAVAAAIALASPAFADRTQVFTVRPEDGTFCEHSEAQGEQAKNPWIFSLMWSR